MLQALEPHLMDEEAVRIFCEEYAAERNRLQANRDAGRTELERELRQVTADHKKLVDAIIAGVPAEQVKDRMIELGGRRKDLERQLSAAPAPDPIRVHPNMAKTYRARIGQLIAGLSESRTDGRGEGGAVGAGREVGTGTSSDGAGIPQAGSAILRGLSGRKRDSSAPGLELHLHGAFAIPFQWPAGDRCMRWAERQLKRKEPRETRGVIMQRLRSLCVFYGFCECGRPRWWRGCMYC